MCRAENAVGKTNAISRERHSRVVPLKDGYLKSRVEYGGRTKTMALATVENELLSRVCSGSEAERQSRMVIELT